jgi:hypothetical protein
MENVSAGSEAILMLFDGYSDRSFYRRGECRRG